MTAARTGRRGQLDGWTNPLRDARDKRLPRIAGPCGLVIFGVTGDLSRKKLMPAIYDLANRGLLPPGFALTGFARRDWDAQDFGQVVHDAVREHARTPFRQNVWDRLAEGFRFVPGSFDDDDVVRPPGEDRPGPRPGPRHRRQPRVLPVDPAVVVPGGVQAARPVGPVGPGRRPVAAGGDREAVRARPGVGASSSTRSSTTSSPRSRCSASTTTSARRPSRTSWRCGSPTSCSSRSGTATTSTTCRSRWPRTSAWAGARATTTASARPATSSRTTCCSCWRSPRWRSPPRSPPDELRAEKIKVLNATRLVVPAGRRPPPAASTPAAGRAASWSAA